MRPLAGSLKRSCSRAIALLLLLLGSAAAEPNALNAAFFADSFPIPTTGSRRMETRFSPCSDHNFVVDKSGNFIAYSSVADEKNFQFTIKDAVYELADHGPTGMLIHPNFPATPSIFMYYTADPTNKWKDACPLKPDADGFSYCDTKQRLQRFDLKVTMMGARCTAFALAKSQILVEDWCSTSSSHGNGNIEWWNGANMILTSGDGAMSDFGQRKGDVCFNPAKKLPQGRFRSQREDGFLQGKLLLFKAASLLKNANLVVKTDYNVVAKGLRQPYVNTVNPWTGDVLIGDVGSKIWEEVNLVTKAEMLNPAAWPLNFGWPCLEGRSDFADPTDFDFMWLEKQCDPAKDFNCDFCKTVWPCANGVNSAGCSSKFRAPAFQFRDTIDRDNAGLCRSETHAIVGLTWMVGADFGNAAIPYALVGSDYGSGCIFYWDVDPATKRVKFENGASVLATNHIEGLYLTRGEGGYLYSSTTGQKDTLWRFGLVKAGGIAKPTASLATFLRNDATGTFSAINCDAGCQIKAGSTIKLDASGSKAAAGGGKIATYQFKFGDGTFTGKLTTPTAVKKYAAAGSFAAMVTVTDTGGRVDTDSRNILVRTSAAAITTNPASGAWKLGDTISYALTGITAADVQSVAWDATVTHCRPNICTGGVDCHTHTNGVNADGTAFAGKLTPPGHAMPSSMTITATVTPKTGTPFDVSAETTALQYTATVAAVTGGDAVQAGWPVGVVDVKTCFSPCQVLYMAKITSDLAPLGVLFRGNKVYGFTAWSVTKAAGTTTQVAGNIPVTENGMKLMAKYAEIAGVVDDAVHPGPALVGVAAHYGFVEVKWTAPAGATYNWVLISITSSDGMDRSSAAPASARQAIVSVPATASMTYAAKLAGYNSATRKRSAFGGPLPVASVIDPTKTCYDQSAPYGNAPAALPGTIEFEKFDIGGEGTAYHDTTPGNSGKAFREFLDVDIQNGGSNGFSVIQAADGEWLQYTVRIAATKKYRFTFYLASVVDTKKSLYLMMDAMSCKKAFAFLSYQQIGSTGGAAKFVAYTAAVAVTLMEGEHTLRVCLAAPGLVLDKMVITAA